MRLLNVHTLELETFDYRVPPYTIASHRWNEGTESSFQDVQAKRNLDRAGYKKIERFTAFVRDRLPGLNYLWIDTCCIDKTNSQELQEAITAMYKWYESADVCLVYLNDVDDIYSSTHQIAVENLRRSVWFTRGWTLQELLAPRLVVFLSSAWEVLGHKAQDDDKAFSLPLDNAGPKLNRQIASITGIPGVVIAQPDRRKSLPVQEKLAWASTRSTTRPEDMAYCLLGLFEVSMPLIYQEGARAAQRRLMTAIAETNNAEVNIETTVPVGIGDSLGVRKPGFVYADHKRFENHIPPSSTVPFLRDPEFVNRTEICQMEQKLSVPGTRVALTGLGGVGKSQLALEYCYRLRERCPDVWVLWVHVGTAARYEQSLRKLAGDFGIFGQEDAKLDIFDMVYHWLRDVRNGKWLLVLDSADDAGFLFEPPSATSDPPSHNEASASRRTVLDFLPICPHGSIILTSRYRAVAAKFTDDQNIISVLPMSLDDAVAVFNGRTGYSHDPNASERLVAALDCMPLAISQAAAYIKKRVPRCSIEEYLEKLEKSSKSKARLLSKVSTELRRDPMAENSIILTWQISFRQVQALRKSAADLLSLMSFFDHQSIPLFLMRNYRQGPNVHTKTLSPDDDDDDEDGDGEDGSMSGNSYDSDADEEAFEDDIAILQDYDFISAAPSGKDFKIHQLIQFASQMWLKSKGQYNRWMAQGIWNLNCALPHAEFENWTKCEVLYPHARLMLDTSPKERDARLWRLSILLKAAWFALEKASLTEAEKLVHACIQERERLVGHDSRSILSLTAFLAYVLVGQGKYEKAEQVLRRMLAKLNGETQHDSRFILLERLALVLAMQGQYDKAKQMAQRALDGLNQVLGSEHPSTLRALGTLALVLRYQAKYEESEQMQRHVIAAQEAALGPEHPDTLSSEIQIATVLQYQGRYEEAAQKARRVLDGLNKVPGPTHPSTLGAALGTLASVLQCQAKYEESEQMQRRVVATQEAALGPEHPDTLSSELQIAEMLQCQGRYEEAARIARRVLDGLNKVLGSENPSTLEALSTLAFILQCQAKYEESEQMQRRVLAIQEAALGSDHPSTLLSELHLTTVLHCQGSFEEAEYRLQRILRWAERILGSKDPMVLPILDNQCMVLEHLGRYEEAERAIRRALEQREKVFGSENPDTLRSIWILAWLKSEQQMYDEAISLYERASAGLTKVLGALHPITIECCEEFSSMREASRQE